MQRVGEGLDPILQRVGREILGQHFWKNPLQLSAAAGLARLTWP
jgi:hypothetical protein